MPTAGQSDSPEASLRYEYRRNLRRAFLLAVGLHLLAAVAVNPGSILHFFRGRVTLGYSGSSTPGSLAPIGDEADRDASFVRSLRRRGPFHLVKLSQLGETLTPEKPQENAPEGRVDPGGPAETEAHRGRPRTGMPGAGIVVELDESWSAVRSSGPVAQSEMFQTLKIVRPDYPPEAIHAGIQGLVKLEVQVDTLGQVVGVRTLQNSAGSQALEEAAVHAMRLWQFKPYRSGSRSVPFIVLVPFRYRLID